MLFLSRAPQRPEPEGIRSPRASRRHLPTPPAGHRRSTPPQWRSRGHHHRCPGPPPRRPCADEPADGVSRADLPPVPLAQPRAGTVFPLHRRHVPDRCRPAPSPQGAAEGTPPPRPRTATERSRRRRAARCIFLSAAFLDFHRTPCQHTKLCKNTGKRPRQHQDDKSIKHKDSYD